MEVAPAPDDHTDVALVIRNVIAEANLKSDKGAKRSGSPSSTSKPGDRAPNPSRRCRMRLTLKQVIAALAIDALIALFAGGLSGGITADVLIGLHKSSPSLNGGHGSTGSSKELTELNARIAGEGQKKVIVPVRSPGERMEQPADVVAHHRRNSLLAYNAHSSSGSASALPALFFSAFEPTHGREPYISDSQLNGAGTTLYYDLNPGPASSDPTEFTVFRGKVYFSADDGVGGRELFVHEGTGFQSAGIPVRVRDICPGRGGSDPRELYVYHNGVTDYLVFTADDCANGRNVWVTEGTEETTKPLIEPERGGPAANVVAYFTTYQGKLWFTGYQNYYEYVPFISNGTSEGTHRFVFWDLLGNALDIAAGAETSPVCPLWTDVDNPGFNRQYTNTPYECYNLVRSKAGWRSDPSLYTECNGKLFFVATDGINNGGDCRNIFTDRYTCTTFQWDKGLGYELYVTDGREYTTENPRDSSPMWNGRFRVYPGTYLVQDLDFTEASSFPQYLTCHADTLFFSAIVESGGQSHGREVSD
jgi:ELWxxDGT repeat protein